eukprot:m51a1_g7145 hypothetical protein (213) ;mRNA; r:316907-317835
MFGLCRYAAKLVAPTAREYSVLLLGLDRAGKTTLLDEFRRFLGLVAAGEPREREYRPTTGTGVARGSHARCRVCVTDLGGREKSRRAWVHYYADTHAILWVIDASDQERAQESVAVLGQTLEAPELASCPVCVVFTRADVGGASAAAEGLEGAVAAAVARAAGGPRDLGFARVGEEGAGVKDVADWVARCLREGAQRDQRRAVVDRLREQSA